MITDLSKMTEVREIPLRSTFMSDEERCPRYALLRHRAGLVPRGFQPDARFRGDLLHKVAAHRLNGLDQPHAESMISGRMAKLQQKVLDSLDDSGYTPAGKTPEEAIKSLETETKVAIAMSRAYCNFFGIRGGHADVLTDNDGQITRRSLPVYDHSVERPILRVGDLAADEFGELDSILIDEGTRTLYVLDHKTSGMDIVAYMRTLPLAAQTLLYPRLAEVLCEGTDLKVGGVIYNVIRTPTIRCCKTDGFDLDRYAERVEKWYADNLDTVVAQTLIRPSPELKKLSSLRLTCAAQMCNDAPLLDQFPATGGSACQAYNSLCPFIGLCPIDTALWPEQLARFDRHWRDDEHQPINHTK